MIKKLRKRFIVASMLSLFIVLAVIMSIVSFISYKRIVRRADETLDILADNNGRFPSGSYMEEYGLNPNESIELPYESRFFSVLVGEREIVISVDTGKIAAVNTKEAVKYAIDVLKSGKSRGYQGDYRYRAVAEESGVRIIFLDMGRVLENFRSFVSIGILISIVGLIIVYVLIVLTSKRITKPVLESYEKQKRFITDAGHEIKTPLAIINADAEVLQMDLGENEWLSDIKTQTTRLTELSSSLTMLARMDEGADSLNMSEFNISELVSEMTESYKARAILEEKILKVEILPDIIFCGDKKMIEKLLSVILDNAFKYSSVGGNIDVRCEKARAQVIIEVTNTTDYISRENTKYLFERFYRTDASRSSKTGGYGLGLSIARAIVNSHGGEISATTDDEKSLKIQIKLPIK